MMRRAESLKSLDELKLSKTTRTHLEKNFESIDEIIKYGRVITYNGISVKDSKWKTELVSAINEAGFIRSREDFIISFRVGDFYRTFYGDNGEYFIWKITQLSNEEYENFVPVTGEKLELLRGSLSNRLPEREYDILCLRFGLYDNEPRMSHELIGRLFNVKVEEVRNIEKRVFRKLRRSSNSLPAILVAPKGLSEAANKLISELDELHKSPIFVRHREILSELKFMDKMPVLYPYSRIGNRTDLSFAPNHRIPPIRILNLSTRSYNCLIRSGINTVFDIINYPKDKWSKIRNLGPKSIDEIVEKMHLCGYKDFYVYI